MNFKSIMIVLLLIFNIAGNASLHAQKKSKKATKRAAKKAQVEQERLDLAYIDSHEGFSVTEVPEEWKDESAVVLCVSTNFIYTKEKAKKISVREMVRKRIKLQDKAAVEDFSEFYYVNARSSSIGFSIIKPDGREIKVNSSEAIDVETEIPTIFRAYNRTLKYKKLAIPGLEVGDIIDYAYVYDADKYPTGPDAFDAVIVTLPRKYPMVKQIVDFKVNNGFYLNFNSYNDAPELKSVALKVEDKTSRRYDNFKRYRFTDDMREKKIDEKWHYEYRSLPTIKFQVYYFPPKFAYATDDWVYFIGEPGEAKKKVSKSDIRSKMNSVFKYANTTYGTKILEYLRKYHKKEKNKKKLVALTYYYFRHIVAAYPGFQMSPESRSNKYFNNEVNDVMFALTLKQVFKQKGIDYDINYLTPRTIGTVDQVLFPAELSVFMTAKVGKENIVLTNFEECTNMGDIPFYLEGTAPLDKHQSLRESLYGDNMRVSDYASNNVNMQTTATLNPAMDVMTLDRRTTATGHNRHYYWDNTLVGSDYLAKEHQKYPVTKQKSYYQIKITTKENKKLSAAKQKEVAKSKKEENKQRMEHLEELVGDAIGAELESYDHFEIIQDGRYHDKPEYIYEETFTLKDFVQKAGGNYIVEAGKLIDQQFQVKEDMLDRNYDIYMRSARSYDNKVTFTIPEGYTIQGVEALNINVENDTGFFKSTATVEGNQLIIETNKAYKNNFEPKENWDKMVAFLDAAYQFTQQKVVLKKG